MSYLICHPCVLSIQAVYSAKDIKRCSFHENVTSNRLYHLKIFKLKSDWPHNNQSVHLPPMKEQFERAKTIQIRWHHRILETEHISKHYTTEPLQILSIQFHPTLSRIATSGGDNSAKVNLVSCSLYQDLGLRCIQS